MRSIQFCHGSLFPNLIRKRKFLDPIERWQHKDVNNVPIPVELEEYMPLITRGIYQDAKRNYALRTCIDLKPWEGEDQYIRIFQGGGCYSYIGWAYYTQQVLSIGSRCNSQGLFNHFTNHKFSTD